MPSKHSLNVSLTGQLSDFIEGQVASGRYRTGSEVVRDALRLLEREQASVLKPFAESRQGGATPPPTQSS
jgi:putative addiction module CopG family antidote